MLGHQHAWPNYPEFFGGGIYLGSSPIAGSSAAVSAASSWACIRAITGVAFDSIDEKMRTVCDKMDNPKKKIIRYCNFCEMRSCAQELDNTLGVPTLSVDNEWSVKDARLMSRVFSSNKHD